MKKQPILLPLVIALFTGCNDDNTQTSIPAPKPEIKDHTLQPGAAGDITTFGGAIRLKQERTAALQDSLSDKNVKNIILYIGDGTSDSEITAARNYISGAAGYLKGIDVLPFTGSYSTYALDRNNGSIDYVTDSAASATAWATGVKTYNNALGVNYKGQAYQSILELAKKVGLATGNVTTTELQDATPASQFAKISLRKCYAPSSTTKNCPEAALEKGGLGSITEQLIKVRADVTLGGGAASFNEKATAGIYQGKTLLEQAQREGYQIVRDLNGLKSVLEANNAKPVLGLFSESNLPVIWKGPQTRVYGPLDQAGIAEKCTENEAFAKDKIPTLKQMTEKAIDLLKMNQKGFFLQVESGSIDKQNHAANPCGQIGETLQLDEAIQVGLEFAKKNGDTLIIVTGDHAHTSQIIPIDAVSPGQTATLLTQDNVPMRINYGTAIVGLSQEHTGSQVRIAAYGPRAANVSGLLDQTDLFFIMRDALGIK